MDKIHAFLVFLWFKGHYFALMEVRYLEAFLAVAREGSFSRAAVRLALTQPSLSARIQQLEQELETKLFVRESRPLTLTPAGQLFLPYAERVLGILEAGREAVRVAQSGLAGQLSIGCPVSVSTYLMPQVVERFSQAYPQMELFMETSHSSHLVKLLEDGVLDMTFTAVFPHLVRQAKILLRLPDEIIAAVSADHPLAQASQIAVDDLWQYRVILPRWGSSFEAYIKSLRGLSPGLQPMMHVPLATALPMIQNRAKDLLTFVPRRVAMAVGLVEVQVRHLAYTWDMVLITRPGRSLSVPEEGFVQMVKLVMRE